MMEDVRVVGTIHRPSEGLTQAPTMIVLAVLLHKLGGLVDISQKDIDEVAYGRIFEGCTAGGALTIKLQNLKDRGTDPNEHA